MIFASGPGRGPSSRPASHCCLLHRSGCHSPHPAAVPFVAVPPAVPAPAAVRRTAVASGVVAVAFVEAAAATVEAVAATAEAAVALGVASSVGELSSWPVVEASWAEGA